MCAALMIVALGAAQMKRPYTAFAYFTLSIGSGTIILLTSNLARSQHFEPGQVCSPDETSLDVSFNKNIN